MSAFVRLSRVLAKSSGGIAFYCPGCHDVHIIATNLYNPNGRPTTWQHDGNNDHPTFSPSILVTRDGPVVHDRCHSFVRNGRIEFLSDCTHELANQTVDLPEFPSSWIEGELS